jgi:hypothetical protein
MSELLNELEAEERALDKKKRKKERLKQNQKMRKEGGGADEPAPNAPAAQTIKYGTRCEFCQWGRLFGFPCLGCLAWVDAFEGGGRKKATH